MHLLGDGLGPGDGAPPEAQPIREPLHPRLPEGGPAAANARTALLRVEHLAKRFGAIVAIDDVSLELRAGEIHGLCGHNGAGKSTLVRVLMGLVQPDSGGVLLDGRPLSLRGARDAQAHGLAFVDQELSVVPALTVEENLFLGDTRAGLVRRRSSQRRLAGSALERVGLGGLAPTRAVEALSVGERQLLEIARALHRQARLLILDEPTATLTQVEIDKVFAAVREVAASGFGVIFVSHRLGEVLDLCHRVTVLRDGRVAGSHSVSDLDRDRLVELLVGEAGSEPGAARPPARRRRPAAAGTVSLRAVVPPGWSAPCDLELGAGEVVGLAGQVGSGASELLRALGGLSPKARGEVSLDGRTLPLGSVRAAIRAGVVYISNDRKGEGLFLGRSVAENLVASRLSSISRGGALPPRAVRGAAGRLASRVAVDPRRLSQPAATLSGGNQQKVFIGRAVDRERTRLLLLDEPTRGVDVSGRTEIHALVRLFADGGATVVFSSTDLEELLDLADLVVTVFEQRIVSKRPREAVVPSTLLAEMTMGGPEPVVAP